MLNTRCRKGSDPRLPTGTRVSSADPHRPFLLGPDNQARPLGAGSRLQLWLEQAAGPGPPVQPRSLRASSRPSFRAIYSSTSFPVAFLLWSFGQWVLTTLSTLGLTSPQRDIAKGSFCPRVIPTALGHSPTDQSMDLPKGQRAFPNARAGLSYFPSKLLSGPLSLQPQGCRHHLRTATSRADAVRCLAGPSGKVALGPVQVLNPHCWSALAETLLGHLLYSSREPTRCRHSPPQGRWPEVTTHW